MYFCARTTNFRWYFTVVGLRVFVNDMFLVLCSKHDKPRSFICTVWDYFTFGQLVSVNNAKSDTHFCSVSSSRDWVGRYLFAWRRIHDFVLVTFVKLHKEKAGEKKLLYFWSIKYVCIPRGVCHILFFETAFSVFDVDAGFSDIALPECWDFLKEVCII